MSRLLVAEHFRWDQYPGLRVGRLYSGQGDLPRRPRGETHAVAQSTDGETVCGLPRSPFPYEFEEPVGMDLVQTCRACGVAAPGR